MIIPAILCAVVIVAVSVYTSKDMTNSDYRTTGNEDAEFGMVLQHYSTFDHSEKTHIAIALSWYDGALNLNGGRALARIKAKVLPINLENQEIEWSCTDAEIATVDETGRIDAAAPGNVEITANLVNYGKTKTAKLAVKQPVTGIFLPITTLTLYKDGNPRYLQARIFPGNASNKTVKWSSKDTKVARVDSNGTVKPMGIGVTEITAVTEDGSFKGSCFVTVVNPSVDVTELTLQNEQDMAIRVGDNINAIITVLPSNAKNKTLKWSSDNEAVATVSQTGRIHGESVGEANITAQSVNGIKKTFEVEVTETDGKDPFIIGGDDGIYSLDLGEGTVVYTSYDITLPQAVRIQMQQNPPPQIWTQNGSVNASETETAEYMNPNNYYTDAYKYQFLDLSRPNGISAEELDEFLADKGVLKGMGRVFVRAARDYSVSEVYLVVHACLETGNGTSQLARGVEVNGETVYNMFGIGAFDESAVYSGSQKAYREGWTSIESAIRGGAEWISRFYINSGDGRQNTLYKMLFNPENPGEHQYATDIGWAVKQALTIERVFSVFPDASLSFDVPVYSGQRAPALDEDSADEDDEEYYDEDTDSEYSDDYE